jgi:hypothetical protein
LLPNMPQWPKGWHAESNKAATVRACSNTASQHHVGSAQSTGQLDATPA